MNDDIRKAVLTKLDNAEDDFLRASAAFRGADLSAQHGESGQTRGALLEGYRVEVERWKTALASLA